MTNKLQITCCICQDYRDREDKTRWYTPTPTERRELHFNGKKLTHSYCPTCYLLHLREVGVEISEIERMAKEAESIVKKPSG